MILYSDFQIRQLESAGKWMQSISYIENKRNTDKNNVSLFLRYVVTAWYVLTLDGSELSLSSDEYSRLCEILRKGYVIFESMFAQNCICQWMFGYIKIAKLLHDIDHASLKEISEYRRSIKNYIYECFDENQEIDSYFIEMLTVNFR